MSHNETQFLIGKAPPEGAARDAIHVAVLPVVAAEDLRPAERVFLTEAGTATRAGQRDTPLGIVDPFLAGTVYAGERFWLFLQPNTVAGMRHHWQHPTVDGLPEPLPNALGDPVEAAAWLRDFAGRWGLNYSQMIETATEGDDYLTAQGRECHGPEDLGEDYELFWWHLETLKRRRFNRTHRDSVGWSCSC